MKKVLALVLCLMMVLAVSASAKEISEIKIGYILKPESNEYWSSMKAGVLAWAEEKGVQVDVQCVDDESNFTGQLEMMENMINMGYDAICAAPLSANNLVSGAVKAAQNGVHNHNAILGRHLRRSPFCQQPGFRRCEGSPEWRCGCER